MTMNPALSAFNHVVAFEVAKDSLVIHVLPADKQSVAANKPKAIRKVLLAEIQRGAEDGLGAMLVVCEATGGYERHVLDGLQRTRDRRAQGPRIARSPFRQISRPSRQDRSDRRPRARPLWA